VASAVLSAAGLKVALLEKKDFASSTSQESSNLVWGGIKYLESYEFSLVWDLCRSRNELMHYYPNEVREIRFFTTLAKGFRKPRFLVYMGALLYWFMGRFRTRPPLLLSRDSIKAEEPLIQTEQSQGGLEYSDCYLRDNDARFVFRFVRQAQRHGAITCNYTEVQAALRSQEGLWSISAYDRQSHKEISLKSKVIINAAGPYADHLHQLWGVKSSFRHIFSKGVHLIVPRLTESEKVLTFFADDGRLFFVIPMGSCSCIGTTDTRVHELPALVTEEDREFILQNINKRLALKKPLQRGDIISERCGVRPLAVKALSENLDQEEWVNLSRKHEIEVQKDLHLISIFGGKLTDCLNIGRELLRDLRSLGYPVPKPKHWFGEGAPAAREQFYQQSRDLQLHTYQSPGEGDLQDRLWRNYGEDALLILEYLRQEPNLLQTVVAKAPVILAEVKLMALQEHIEELEDFLRRRTRLSLVVPREELQAAPGLKAACTLLFGEQAEQKWATYFSSPS
jgi:glycerol-3-phosphate dehydrogenase